MDAHTSVRCHASRTSAWSLGQEEKKVLEGTARVRAESLLLTLPKDFASVLLMGLNSPRNTGCLYHSCRL